VVVVAGMLQEGEKRCGMEMRDGDEMKRTIRALWGGIVKNNHKVKSVGACHHPAVASWEGVIGRNFVALCPLEWRKAPPCAACCIFFALHCVCIPCP